MLAATRYSWTLGSQGHAEHSVVVVALRASQPASRRSRQASSILFVFKPRMAQNGSSARILRRGVYCALPCFFKDDEFLGL